MEEETIVCMVSCMTANKKFFYTLKTCVNIFIRKPKNAIVVHIEDLKE